MANFVSNLSPAIQVRPSIRPEKISSAQPKAPQAEPNTQVKPVSRPLSGSQPGSLLPNFDQQEIQLSAKIDSVSPEQLRRNTPSVKPGLLTQAIATLQSEQSPLQQEASALLQQARSACSPTELAGLIKSVRIKAELILHENPKSQEAVQIVREAIGICMQARCQEAVDQISGLAFKLKVLEGGLKGGHPLSGAQANLEAARKSIAQGRPDLAVRAIVNAGIEAGKVYDQAKSAKHEDLEIDAATLIDDGRELLQMIAFTAYQAKNAALLTDAAKGLIAIGYQEKGKEWLALLTPPTAISSFGLNTSNSSNSMLTKSESMVDEKKSSDRKDVKTSNLSLASSDLAYGEEVRQALQSEESLQTLLNQFHLYRADASNNQAYFKTFQALALKPHGLNVSLEDLTSSSKETRQDAKRLIRKTLFPAQAQPVRQLPDVVDSLQSRSTGKGVEYFLNNTQGRSVARVGFTAQPDSSIEMNVSIDEAYQGGRLGDKSLFKALLKQGLEQIKKAHGEGAVISLSIEPLNPKDKDRLREIYTSLGFEASKQGNDYRAHVYELLGNL